jgi:hypothetical protein
MPPPNLDHLIAQDYFPGLEAGESRVAHAWLVTRGALYDTIEFNVRLGVGVEPPAELVEPYLSMATELSRKRADILARAGDDVIIIEVKLRASLGAIGQVLGYKSLYEREHPQTGSVRLAIVAQRVDPDAQYAITQNGIDLYL